MLIFMMKSSIASGLQLSSLSMYGQGPLPRSCFMPPRVAKARNGALHNEVRSIASHHRHVFPRPWLPRTLLVLASSQGIL
jgi:hypothetical protein